jgi:hypothetical protein
MPRANRYRIQAIRRRKHATISLHSIDGPEKGRFTIVEARCVKSRAVGKITEFDLIRRIAGTHQKQDAISEGQIIESPRPRRDFSRKRFSSIPSESLASTTCDPPFSRIHMTASTITSMTSLSSLNRSSPNGGEYMTGLKYTVRLTGDGGSLRSPCNTSDAIAVPWTRAPTAAPAPACSSGPK